MKKSDFKLKISPLAENDLHQIIDYIAIELSNPAAAIEQINDFEKAFENICIFPESCPYISNQYVRDKSLRKLIVNNYLIFYRVEGYEIQVIRVLYRMRNYETLL